MNAWQPKKSILILSATAALLLAACLIVITPFGKSFFKLPIKAQQQPALPALAPAEAEGLGAKRVMPIEITIPEGAGHIVEGFKSKNDAGKVVIHIQDIHTNYEAQKNLSRMLETLVKSKGLKLIMVEGGWGNVNLSYLRSYADGERRLEVAEEYLKGGKISGEEYLDIISDYDLILEGLEEESLYRANLNAFFEIEKFRRRGAEELASLKSAAEKVKEEIYPQPLLELEKAGRDYENEKISLADYYKNVNAMVKKTGQELLSFPNFANFMRVVESEKHIKFPSVEKERSKLIEKLSKKLPKQKLTVLVTKSLEFRLNKLTPAEYHSYLIEEAEKAGEALGNYPNLKKYVDYISSHENIDTTRLFEEAEELLLKVKEKLIGDSRQKRLNEISSGLTVLDNFLNLKLVPNDFKYYKEHKNDFLTAGWVEFLNNQIKRHKIKKGQLRPALTVDKNLSTLVNFYYIANERDDVFVKNAIKLMNEKKQDLAVLIAGGFHTPALAQKLRECAISYIIVAPHTTQQTDPELYRYILKYKSGREE